MAFIETSALDSSNVVLAFHRILDGNFMQLHIYIYIYRNISQYMSESSGKQT